MPRVAILTSGGIAPCLSAAIGGLIEKYNTLSPDAEIIGYMHGYRGLLLGETVEFSKKVKKAHEVLYDFAYHLCHAGIVGVIKIEGIFEAVFSTEKFEKLILCWAVRCWAHRVLILVGRI